MSAGHRPTWAPSRGQQSVSHLSQQTHRTGLTSHTKLKFRQPGDGAARDETARRDLKRELELAELEATNKRRALQGLPEESKPETSRAEALRKAIEMDRDEEESADEKSIAEDDDDDSSEEDDDDEDSEEEDETAALLLELEKIKAERAATRALAAQEQSATAQATREEEIAYGNPLLNLEHILHPTANSAGAKKAETLSFGVKRRWDDDVIFKNQAAAAPTGSSGGFVNDLTRSEFHKKFMNRYIR